MSAHSRSRLATLGFGVITCGACCAGPIIGVLAGIGIGTAAGIAVVGIGAAVVGASIASLFVVVRRHRSRVPPLPAVTVELTHRPTIH